MAFIKSFGNYGVECMDTLNDNQIVLFQLQLSCFGLSCSADKIKFRHLSCSFFNQVAEGTADKVDIQCADILEIL